MRVTRVTTTIAVAAQLAIPAYAALAQSAAQLSQQVRTQYVSVSEPVIALTNVTVIDGTGSAPKPNQTVVIQNGRIADIGPSASVRPPSGARTSSGTSWSAPTPTAPG